VPFLALLAASQSGSFKANDQRLCQIDHALTPIRSHDVCLRLAG
jgi:hypothetical protein